MASTLQVATTTGLATADQAANGGTLGYRDGSGGFKCNTLTSTNLVTTGNATGAVSTQTTSFTAAAATDYFCDATSGALTVTFPSASANNGVTYWFTKKDSSVNAITLSGVLGTSTISTQYNHVRVVSDGTSWYGAA
jgi:hypothetical protein